MIIDLTVEVPRGSRNEYSVDRETGRVRLERTLLTDMVYPADCGYLEYTLGDGGDPLNALVLLEEPTYPGVSITVRPVGVFRLSDQRGDDIRILTVPDNDPRWSTILDITDVAAHTRHALQHFFESDIALHAGHAETTAETGTDSDADTVTVSEFGSRDEAERLVTAALNAFRSYDNYDY